MLRFIFFPSLPPPDTVLYSLYLYNNFALYKAENNNKILKKLLSS